MGSVGSAGQGLGQGQGQQVRAGAWVWAQGPGLVGLGQGQRARVCGPGRGASLLRGHMRSAQGQSAMLTGVATRRGGRGAWAVDANWS